MAQAPRSSRMTYIILRYMRRPLLLLVLVYAVSMAGWILIPGLDAEGNPQRLSLFHAFYFLTYTVTTTGFGELPHAFTEAQRMWGIVSLYAGVIAWFYALGSIVGLVQNPEFKQSVAERNFTKRVARISEPFCILCGFGNTGALLTRGLTDAGMTVIVIDKRPERISTLILRDYRTPVAGLAADARIPEHLVEAGLSKPNCKAVVALTQDEEINLKISVTARLLNPDVWVVTQSTSEVHEETLATLGENVHIIDPFQTYAKYLGAVIHDPAIHTLNQWLAGTKGATLDLRLDPPKGSWILCGYGRMGRWLRESLAAENIATRMIEPNPSPRDREDPDLIIGRANQETLLEAGVKEAAGIVAGTNNDSDNLSIVLNARALNPEAFLLVRQNRYRNQQVFQAAQADFVMVPALVAARRMLFLLLAPLLKTFFEALRSDVPGRAGQSLVLSEVMAELERTVGGTRPSLRTVALSYETATAVQRLTEKGQRVTLGDLLRDPVDRARQLACTPLVVRAARQAPGNRPLVMPPPGTVVEPGDEILFCGTPGALRLLDATLNNEYTLRYLISGVEAPRGYLMQWLGRQLERRQNTTTPAA